MKIRVIINITVPEFLKVTYLVHVFRQSDNYRGKASKVSTTWVYSPTRFNVLSIMNSKFIDVAAGKYP